MFGLIRKMFIGLLTTQVNRSNHPKCGFLSNQKCMPQPTLINLYPCEFSQALHYYPFTFKLDKCVESCNTIDDLNNAVCVSIKAKDLNSYVFNMIRGKNESRISTKDISR